MKEPSAKKETVSKNKLNRFFPLLVFILACLQYANTCLNDYAWDDAIVIRDNIYTKQGFAGLKDIWTKPVYISQQSIYRPIPQTTFALEQQFFGDHPGIGHAVNTLLYGICCMLLFITLRHLLPHYHIRFALLAALLFVVHPVHTEVVANIKSRDEILALLFSLCSLFYFINYLKKRKLTTLLPVAGFFLLAILSKLNAITILAVYPLIYLFFQQNIQPPKKEITQYWLQFKLPEKGTLQTLNIPASWQPLGLVLFLISLSLAIIFQFKLIATLCIVLWSFILWCKQNTITLPEWSIAAILLALTGVFFNLEYSLYTGMLICLFPLIYDKHWHAKQLLPFILLALSFLIIGKSLGIAGFVIFMLAFAYGLHRGKWLWAVGTFLLLSLFVFSEFKEIMMGSFLLLMSGTAFFSNKLNTNKALAIFLPLLCLIAFLELFVISSNNNNLSYQISTVLFPPQEVPASTFPEEAIKIIDNTNLDLTIINNSLVKVSSTEDQYATIAGIQLRYLGKLFFPYALVHTYGFNSIPKLSWWHWMPWLSVLIHLLLFIFAAFRIFRGDPIAFGILFYFITISIYSHVVRLGPDTMAERFLFFPSLGFSIAFVFFLAGLCKADFSKKIFSATGNTLFFSLFSLILIGFFTRTFVRNMDWKDNRTLATNTLKFAPNNALMHANYASEWMHVFEQNPTAPQLAHIPKDATDAYEKAIAIHPNYFNAIIDLGSVYLKWGKNQLARQTFQKGIAVNPKNPLPDYYLGLLAFSEKNYTNGITQFETAQQKYEAMGKEHFKKDEIYGQLFMFLARCYFKTGNLHKAETVLLYATHEIQGQNIFLVLLGKMYAEQGDLPNAIKNLEEAFKISPSDQTIRRQLYDYHNLMGNSQKATEYYNPQ